MLRTPKKACWLPGNRTVDIRWSERRTSITVWSLVPVGCTVGWEGRCGEREKMKEMKGRNKHILCTKCIKDQQMYFNCIVFYCVIVTCFVTNMFRHVFQHKRVSSQICFFAGTFRRKHVSLQTFRHKHVSSQHFSSQTFSS